MGFGSQARERVLGEHNGRSHRKAGLGGVACYSSSGGHCCHGSLGKKETLTGKPLGFFTGPYWAASGGSHTFSLMAGGGRLAQKGFGILGLIFLLFPFLPGAHMLLLHCEVAWESRDQVAHLAPCISSPASKPADGTDLLGERRVQ